MNKSPFILLIDTTTLYSALVYRGLENKVLRSGKCVYVTTEFTIAEIYWLLKNKRRLASRDAIELIKSAPLLIVKHDTIKHKWQEASDLIGFRDASDVPLVALALSLLHDGIWSTDKDFEVVECRFKIWKTRDLCKALNI